MPFLFQRKIICSRYSVVGSHGVPGELVTLLKYAIKTYFAIFFVLVSSFQKYKNEKYLYRERWKKWILKKMKNAQKNLIFCEFFRAIFSCNFEFSVHDGNICIKKKTVIGAIQINGTVRKLLKTNRVVGGYPVN